MYYLVHWHIYAPNFGLVHYSLARENVYPRILAHKNLAVRFNFRSISLIEVLDPKKEMGDEGRRWEMREEDGGTSTRGFTMEDLSRWGNSPHLKTFYRFATYTRFRNQLIKYNIALAED